MRVDDVCLVFESARLRSENTVEILEKEIKELCETNDIDVFEAGFVKSFS